MTPLRWFLLFWVVEFFIACLIGYALKRLTNDYYDASDDLD